MCVGDFFAFGEDSFFLPVAFAAGSTRSLRDINYIFQRWMQFRNKNPLNICQMAGVVISFPKQKNKRGTTRFSSHTDRHPIFPFRAVNNAEGDRRTKIIVRLEKIRKVHQDPSVCGFGSGM